MGGAADYDAVRKCGLKEQGVFVIALVCGTACSILSKTMMEMHGVGATGQVEKFEKPLFQTFGMFVGMVLGLAMHYFVLAFRIPFPGYNHVLPPPPPSTPPTLPSSPDDSPILPVSAVPGISMLAASLPNEADRLLAGRVPQPSYYRSIKEITESEREAVELAATTTAPAWMYFFLAIPSVFDLGATAFCMMGLVYLDVSIYQLLRGSGIVFVALMKQYALGDRLRTYQWIGVFWNVVSVLLVGATAILNSSDNEDDELERDTRSVEQALLGVVLVLAGAFVQAMQFVFEEKVMRSDNEYDAVPPLLLIGMEGLWGTVLCLVFVYPIAYYIPGGDHGSYEDPFNTWHMLVHTPAIQEATLIYLVAIFGYNLFAVLVTFLLNSVWHAILDNFRPITVWVTDMVIYYWISALVAGAVGFGEPWTRYSWIQLLGMFVLLYGTAVYNAPNPGSIRLRGKWYHFLMDLSSEYDDFSVVDNNLRGDSWRSCASYKSAFGSSQHSISRAL